MKSVRSLNVTLDFCPHFPVANVFWRSPLKGPRSEANWHSRVRQSVCVKCSKTQSKSLPTCWISKYQMEPTGRRARKQLQPMRPDTALLSPPSSAVIHRSIFLDSFWLSCIYWQVDNRAVWPRNELRSNYRKLNYTPQNMLTNLFTFRFWICPICTQPAQQN